MNNSDMKFSSSPLRGWASKLKNTQVLVVVLLFGALGVYLTIRSFALTTVPGLSATYYNNKDLTGTSQSRIDPNINFYWTTEAPIKGVSADTFSTRWAGKLTVPVTGNYTFYTHSNDGMRVWLDGKKVVADWTDGVHDLTSSKIALTKGTQHSFKVEFYENAGNAAAVLSWAGPGFSKQVIPASQFTTEVSTAGDSINPVVSVTTPVSGSTVTGTIRPAAAATDNVGVAKVEFYLDGALKQTVTAAPYCFTGNTSGTCNVWDSQNASNGSHTLLVKAYDAAGNTGSNTSTFTVSNSPVTTTPPPPTPTPTPTPSPSGSWWGWDPASTSLPPLLPDFPWSTNTGVWNATDRANLVTVNGDLTTTQNNQVIDMKRITGKLIVNHTGVIIKRSSVSRIENNTSSPVVAIHIDLGDGAAGDYKSNGTKGPVHLYRSNVFGVTDGVMTQASGSFIMQDNFIHDLRYAHDSTQPGGNTHNDSFQINSTSVTALFKHNTVWAWAMNDYTANESATRSSGPHWTDKGTALTSVGYSGRSGDPANGLQNSGIIVGGGSNFNPDLTVDSNLFRGLAYSYINVQNGTIRVTNNLFAEDENVSGRGIVSGRQNISVWSNNKNYKTGAIIP